MKLAKIVLSVLAIAALPALGCGGGDDDPQDTIDAGDPGDDIDAMDDGGDDEVDPAGDHNTYVVDSVNIPENSNETDTLGFDLDGDGQPDNQLGNAVTAATMAGGLDLQTLLDDELLVGSFILLADVQATSLDAATGVGFRVLLGENAMPAPCEGGDETDPSTCGKHLAGDATFEVDPGSPDALVVGSIAGGQLDGGPGNVSLVISLGEGAPLTLDLIQARVDASVAADGITSGRIGGAITEEDLNEDVFPALASVIDNIVQTDCAPSGDTCTCEAGSTGETLTSPGALEFDPDGNCMVTTEEVMGNPTIGLVIKPDVDLFDASGNPGQDGENDSMSVGIGFTAVGATFDPSSI